MNQPPPEDDPPPVAPVMPDLDDCCGQGCDPCVFDVFEAARQRHLAALAAWQARRSPASSGASGGEPAQEPPA